MVCLSVILELVKKGDAKIIRLIKIIIIIIIVILFIYLFIYLFILPFLTYNDQKRIKLLRTVPTIVIAHTFCASQDIRIFYSWC